MARYAILSSVLYQFQRSAFPADQLFATLECVCMNTDAFFSSMDANNGNWVALVHVAKLLALFAEKLLKGANDEVKEKFLSNMSSRARSMFIDDMEAKGPLRITDVEDAQKSIMRIARKLSDAGELMLAGRGDDFV